ncbi:plasmid stabilization protein [Halobacteriales archaeon SW_6_65_15]|jgi:plastocyanin|nr:MAG: plasmid stabilization protein [Halobacteriales archaeon SW_6_65_15]
MGATGLAGCPWKPSSSDVKSEVTVSVGPDGLFAFDPETISVSPETTVVWVWEKGYHNIVTSSIPEDGSWEGTPGDATITYGRGYTYRKTFSVVGDYTYYCQPHLSAGMVGTVTVE